MQQRLLLFIQDTFRQEEIPSSNKTLWQYLFGMLLLFCCSIKLYAGLQNIMDVQFADEAAYLRFGLDLFEKMNRNWGPLYQLWYKCLSFITTDTIQLYYLSFQITSVLVGILLYVFLLRISVHPVLALFISFTVLISDLNITVWPRISHFCIVLCIIALIIISFLKNNIYKCIVFTLLCLICSYARPEFYLSFLLMMIVTVACIIYNKSTLTKKDIYIFICVLLLIGILHYIFRFPSNDFFGYNRGVAAFYQHYAWNYKMRTGESFDAWLQWEDLAKRQFGDCNSMWCVIKTQPEIFVSNTLFNIRTYFIQLLKVFTYIFPVGLFHWKKIQQLLLGISLLSFIVLLVRKESRQYFLSKLYSYKFYLLILFSFILPTLLSCIVVFPRDHYLYLQMLFVLLILISAISYLFKNYSTNPILFIVFGVLLFLATPNVKKYNFIKVNTETNLLCNKELVNYLEKDYNDKPHTLFTNMPFISGLLSTNFKEVNTIFDKKKNKPFAHYLDSAKIDMIVVTPSTLRDPHISSDSTWIQFMINYETKGFKKQKFSDCEVYVLTKDAPKSQR